MSASVGSFTDSRDGQTYRTVKIGSQVWMAENLNFKIDGSYCYKNDESYAQKYGRLYTWDAAMRACPAGWHLPTDEEWDELVEEVGDVLVEYEDEEDVYYWEGAGKNLKSKTGWNDGGNGTDEYGFSALPGGDGTSVDDLSGAGRWGYWWSATETGSYAECRGMNRGFDSVEKGPGAPKTHLHSVRCIAD